MDARSKFAWLLLRERGQAGRRRKNEIDCGRSWHSRPLMHKRSRVLVTGRASGERNWRSDFDFIVRRPFASDAGMVTSTTIRWIFEYGRRVS